MINTKEIYEIKTEKAIMVANQEDSAITLRGNGSFDKVLGVNVLIWENDEATGLIPVMEVQANPTVSVQESTGRILLPNAPYHLIKASQQVPFGDRFIEFDGVKGHDLDINIRVNTKNISKAVTVYATAVYSRKK